MTTKPYFTNSELIVRLKSYGLIITDEKAAAECLRRSGYYRFSGYCHPFCKTFVAKEDSGKLLKDKKGKAIINRSDQFFEGINFGHIWDIYKFDQKLRLLVLDAVGRIEVALRAEIANQMGPIDTLAYKNKALMDPKFLSKKSHVINQDDKNKTGNNNEPVEFKSDYDVWFAKFEEKFNNSHEDFVRHHKEKYDGELPIWAAVEIWDFGMLSRYFNGMRPQDKIIITQNYGLSSYKMLASWFHAINVVRNISAHNARLWNRKMSQKPKLPINKGIIPYFDPLLHNNKDDGENVDDAIRGKLYCVLCIISYLLRQTYPNSQWPSRIRALLLEFPTIPGFPIDKIMKVPNDWHKHWFFLPNN
ncbi:MAG: Abi family protein [Candidatus Symbiobacter sp.]|nr:Abi family protein [Candidatus Symbiobacter sp.]